MSTTQPLSVVTEDEEHTEESAEITLEKARNKAYSSAIKSLREARREEFDRYMVTEMSALGYPDWRPRASATERAIERAKALLAEHGLTPDDLA